MENKNKINIAEILRDMPKGTKLYSPIFGDVKFEVIDEDYNYPIMVNTILPGYNAEKRFTENGLYYIQYTDAEPLLFPSRDMRDWSKFAWKKGDVLVNQDRTTHILFEKFVSNTYTIFTGKYYYSKDDKNEEFYIESSALTESFTLEAESAAQIYINAIEDKLNGKLNRETLEIEKLPEFKDGDIVVFGESVAICRKIYKQTLYFYASLDETFGLMFNDNITSLLEYRLATYSEKQKLFEALFKEGKCWDVEKKQIVDLKPKEHEFKPFDKVLVRDSDEQIWLANFFSCYETNEHFKYQCLIGCYAQCIPYEGNEHLLGTTNNPE